MTPTDWTPEDPCAAEIGSKIASRMCELVGRFVAEIAPQGVEHWGCPAFEMVVDADVAFLLSIVAWETSPTESNFVRLHAASMAVIDAWRKVALQYGFRLPEGL